MHTHTLVFSRVRPFPPLRGLGFLSLALWLPCWVAPPFLPRLSLCFPFSWARGSFPCLAAPPFGVCPFRRHPLASFAGLVLPCLVAPLWGCPSSFAVSPGSGSCPLPCGRPFGSVPCFFAFLASCRWARAFACRRLGPSCALALWLPSGLCPLASCSPALPRCDSRRVFPSFSVAFFFN